MGRKKHRNQRQQKNIHKTQSTGRTRRDHDFIHELTPLKRVLLSAAFLATASSFVIGLMATISGQNRVLATVSFTVTFASFIVGTIQAFPRLTSNVRESIRTIINMSTYLVLSLAVLAIPLLGWLSTQQSVVRIGVGLPFSDNRQDAEPIFRATQLAVQKYTNGTNRIGNYTIQLVPFDDKEIGNVARILSPDNLDQTVETKKFVDFVNDARLGGIIGPFDSGKALVELSTITKAKISMLTPANTNDCLTDKAFATGECDVSKLGSGYYFRSVTSDAVRTRVLAEKLHEAHPDASKVVIFRDGTPFGSQFAKRFEENWTKLTHTSEVPSYDMSGDQMSDAENDLHDLKFTPDIVVFAGTGIKAINLHKVMQSNDTYDDTVFASAASIMNGGFFEHLKQNPKGAVYAITPMPYDDSSKSLSNFINQYNARYASSPTPYAASAYDATGILLEAIKDTTTYTSVPLPIFERTDDFREAIANNIKLTNTSNTTALKGVTGTIRFDASGSAVYGGTSENPGVTVFQFDGDTRQWRVVGEKDD